MPRAQVVALCLVMPLAACSSLEGSDWQSVYTMARNYWNGAPPVSLQQAAAIPYASVGVRIGDGPQALLVLGTTDGDGLLWIAGSTAIETRDGRIVRTSGLERDLTNSWFTSPFRRAATSDSPEPVTISWIADYADRHRFSIPITCRQEPAVDDPVTLLGKTIQTVRVDENCTAPDLDWTFVNSFWFDKTSGFAWRSIQHIRPDLDPIEVEVLRPPA